MRDELSGGWMFGYIDALKRAGVETDLLCVSGRVDRPVLWRHAATGAGIRLLPATRVYRALRRRLRDPYAWTKQEAIGNAAATGVPAALLARQLAPYCATPMAAVSQAIREGRYSALLCQEYEYPRFDICVTLGKVLKTPVFATFQGGIHHLTRLEGVVRPPALRACNGVIIGPEGEAERVGRRYRLKPDKIARIFNPLDVGAWTRGDPHGARRELGIEADALVVSWHGRIDIHRKGLDVLCDAWARLQRANSGSRRRLLLIGTGMDAPRLHRRIHEMRLSDVVWIDEYILDRRRLRRYLSAADVYVFPSRHEGFPVAPLEAMACGLPLVAVDAPGVTDILEDGEASGGVVVPQMNSFALAAALDRVLSRSGWRRYLGEQARRRVQQAFSLETVGHQLRDFLIERS